MVNLEDSTDLVFRAQRGLRADTVAGRIEPLTIDASPGKMDIVCRKATAPDPSRAQGEVHALDALIELVAISAGVQDEQLPCERGPRGRTHPSTMFAVR
jgi:hypothetical protein